MEIDRECVLLGNLFHHIVSDLKFSSQAWEDFVNKGTKLHGLLKSTSGMLSAFTESIQKIADIATNTKGSTKDVGSALTRICVRQKMIENKLKHFTNTFLDNLISPIHEKLEEWKKSAIQLEKDHSKDYKRATQEIKKRNSDTARLQKKARKGSKPDLQHQLSSAMYDVNERCSVLEETERSALRNLLVEERSRICLFANCLAPILDLQVSILNEASHLNDLSANMAKLCRNPKQLPTSTELLVQDYINNHTPTAQELHSTEISEFSNNASPPSSPTSDSSRKSSMCSLNSLASSDSRSSGSLNRASSFHQRHYQGHHNRNSSGSLFQNGLGSPTSCKSAPVNGMGRLSVSSHDSGFVSAGNGALSQQQSTEINSRYLLPLLGIKNNTSTDDISNGTPGVIRSCSHSQQIPPTAVPSNNPNRFSWKDWSKPGPYDIQISGSTASDGVNSLNKIPSGVAHKPVNNPPSADNYNPHKRLHRANTTPSVSYPGSRINDPLPPPPLREELTPISDDLLPLPPPDFFDDNLASNNATLTENSPTEHHVVPVPVHPNPETDYPLTSMNGKSSIGNLQRSMSSACSSRFTTPACSEDTIASHDTGYGSIDICESNLPHCGTEETYSTLPRNYYHSSGSANLSRGSFHKRRASTNGLPNTESINSELDTPGTATIRRKPSCKYNSIRRNTSGPRPIATPTIPAAPVLSTFAHMSYTNDNNNNNNGGQNRNLQQNDKLICDLSLSIHDRSDDSPTPTSTPVINDYSFSGALYNSLPITSYSSTGHN